VPLLPDPHLIFPLSQGACLRVGGMANDSQTAGKPTATRTKIRHDGDGELPRGRACVGARLPAAARASAPRAAAHRSPWVPGSMHTAFPSPRSSARSLCVTSCCEARSAQTTSASTSLSTSGWTLYAAVAAFLALRIRTSAWRLDQRGTGQGTRR